MGFRQRSKSRVGVTLLEVLISIGVMSVGLMGMAALIPLGRMELAEAERLENCSSVGRAAFRDLMIRGYLRPEMWVDPNPEMKGKSPIAPGTYPNMYAVTNSMPTARQYPANGQVMGPPFAPLVIDPLMVAGQYFQETVNQSTLSTSESIHRQIVRVFPFSINLPGVKSSFPEAAPNVPKIARVTLRTVPAAMASVQANNPAWNTAMRYDVASRFFRSTDDLTMKIPVNKAATPIQEFAVTMNDLTNLTMTVTDGISFELRPTVGVAYRKYRGDYSWFLVVEPSLAEAYCPTAQSSPIMGGPTASLLTTRQFRVWTVVCNKRDIRDTSQLNLSTQRNVGERMAWVDFIDRNTARLRMVGMDRGEAQQALELKTNQWFAAVGVYNEPRLQDLKAGTDLRYVMEWYRVVAVANDVDTTDGGQTWYREVTIAGRDFSTLGFEFLDANSYAYPDVTSVARAGGTNSAEPLTAWGVIVSGARAVYEKSVFVDRPSSWSLE
jgi:hypothetical protein